MLQQILSYIITNILINYKYIFIYFEIHTKFKNYIPSILNKFWFTLLFETPFDISNIIFKILFLSYFFVLVLFDKLIKLLFSIF